MIQFVQKYMINGMILIFDNDIVYFPFVDADV